MALHTIVLTIIVDRTIGQYIHRDTKVINILEILVHIINLDINFGYEDDATVIKILFDFYTIRDFSIYNSNHTSRINSYL